MVFSGYMTSSGIEQIFLKDSLTRQVFLGGWEGQDGTFFYVELSISIRQNSVSKLLLRNDFLF